MDLDINDWNWPWHESGMIWESDEPLGEYSPEKLQEYTDRDLEVKIDYGFGRMWEGKHEEFIQAVRIYEKGEDSVIFRYGWLSTLPFSKEDTILTLYLVWSGKPYEHEDGRKNKINDINNLSAYYLECCIDDLDRIARDVCGDKNISIHYILPSAYMDYNIIDDYYFEGEGNAG